MARGGHVHGMGGGGLLMPAYVLITVLKITDVESFKVAIQDLVAADAPFGGRLAADVDKRNSSRARRDDPVRQSRPCPGVEELRRIQEFRRKTPSELGVDDAACARASANEFCFTPTIQSEPQRVYICF